MSESTIYKYTLDPIPEQFVSLPTGASILTVQAQKDGCGSELLCLWAQHELPTPLTNYGETKILIFGTGGQASTELMLTMKYINTVHLANGALVLHIYSQCLGENE